AALHADRDAGARVRVQDAADVLARGMDAAVDDEPGRINRIRTVAELVAVLVDADQARRGDLVEHKAVRIDQEVMLGAGDARADVREDKVRPPVQRAQPVAGGEIDAQLRFFGGWAHRFLRCAETTGPTYPAYTTGAFTVSHSFEADGNGLDLTRP